VTSPRHVPVMPDEVLGFLAPEPGGQYVDCTVGSGGHARLILEASSPDGELLGIDADPHALEIARTRLADFGDRVKLVRGRYERVAEIVESAFFDNVAALLIDTDVSMDQLLGPVGRGRGFTHSGDEPLLMTLDPDQETTATSLLRDLSEGELLEVFGQVLRGGEARKVVRAIVRERAEEPIKRTGQFTRLLTRALGRSGPALKKRISAAYLAMRLATNRDLTALRSGIEGAVEVLRPGGVLVVLTYQGLTHRVARRTLRELEGGAAGPARLIGAPQREARIEVLHGTPLRPSSAETERNAAARSAALFAARKL